MLISKVTKPVFDLMPQVLQEHYTPVDASKPDTLYLLQSDDATELRNAKAREVLARQGAEALLATAQAERDAANTALAAFKTANPDAATAEAATLKRIEAATKEANDKVAKAEAAVTKTRDTLANTIREATLQSVVAGITDEETPGDASLIISAIKDRVVIDVTGDTPKITFLDEAGQVTADDLATFKKGVAENKKFAKIVIGSSATGGGATGSKQQTSGAGTNGKKFGDMNEHERTTLYNSNPGEFARLSELHSKASIAAVSHKPVLIR